MKVSWQLWGWEGGNKQGVDVQDQVVRPETVEEKSG